MLNEIETSVRATEALGQNNLISHYKKVILLHNEFLYSF